MIASLLGFIFACHCAEGALWPLRNDIGQRSGLQASPCCVPAQWEGYIGIADGFITSSNYSDLELIQEHVAFDYTNKLLATNLTAIFVKNPQKIEIRTLENYATLQTFTVQNGKCTKIKNDGFMQRCIPDTATSYPAHVFGVGKQSYVVDSWGWYDSRRKAQSEASLFRDGCIPFGFSLMSTTDKSLQYSMMGSYYNLTEGIQDRSVFDEPPECKDVMVTPRKELPGYMQGLLDMHQLFSN